MDEINAAETVNVAGPVGPQLFRILRERIIRNRLKPGERLSEAEIALQFGVSRQPVRETFIKLAEEDLLEVRPQRGTFVRKISVAAVMDGRFVREAIEADVVKLLAEAADPSLVRDLDRQIARQSDLADSDPVGFRPLDDLFHRTLAEGAGKVHAWSVIEGMKTQMDRVRQLSTEQFPAGKLVAQHSRIVRAIEAGDPVGAEAAMRHHLREILSDLPLVRSSLPDLFE
ncbi:GntR family transcriptional regulator [Rhodobacter sp. NSM]|uniref:GntR family transcriptional regulator n=1 Tax=Rhodobacter sp. NSM TaxID=3457501 RepID=UPI003FD651BD